MPTQPLDCHSCALSIHATLSANPPSLASFSAQEASEPEALGLLAQLLQSSFLNGNPGQESVWTALDRLVPPDLASPRTPALHPFLSLHSADRARDSTEPVDDGAICVSFPFGDDGERSSESVLRGIEIVPYTVELVKVSMRSDSAPSARAGVAASKIEKWWNLEWLEKSEVIEAARDTVVVAKKIFSPQKDRLSVRATWWGYEIYLPEPVFVNVGNDIEPVLTALTYLSTALALLLTKAPPVLVALPGFALLQSLVPIFSAIVSAVTWYWKTIKKMDLGQGIVLSATWVLPVAVVPRPLRSHCEGDTGEQDVEIGGSESQRKTATDETEAKVDRRDGRPNKLRRVLGRRTR